MENGDYTREELDVMGTAELLMIAVDGLNLYAPYPYSKYDSLTCNGFPVTDDGSFDAEQVIDDIIKWQSGGFSLNAASPIGATESEFATLQEFTNALDSDIRTRLGAPDDAFGFLKDREYFQLYASRLAIAELGEHCAKLLIKKGWCY